MAWTRLFIVSAVADLPDTDATATRLLQNQADIGDAVAEFYGDDAGAQLEALLRDHILTAGELIAAAKAGDNAQVEDRSAAWYANGDEIAAFLAGANPAWPVDTLRDMMSGHLDQTLAEATAQLTGDFEASVAEYGHITTHILEMADTLAHGIITQFPDRFPALVARPDTRPPSRRSSVSGFAVSASDRGGDRSSKRHRGLESCSFHQPRPVVHRRRRRRPRRGVTGRGPGWRG